MKKIEVVVWLGFLSLGLIAIGPSLLPIVGLGTARLVALQEAQSSCADDSGAIYVDCGNGTVTDNRTGLIWLKDAGCLTYDVFPPFGAMSLVAALSDLSPTSAIAVADCGLSDGSAPGEWRLPSASEWEEMTNDAIALGCTGASAPPITNDDGSDCWQSGNGSISFVGIHTSFYWAATPFATSSLYGFDMSSSFLSTSSPGGQERIWPVRGGQ